MILPKAVVALGCACPAMVRCAIRKLGDQRCAQKKRGTCALQRRIITPAVKLTQRAADKPVRGASAQYGCKGGLVLPAQSE